MELTAKTALPYEHLERAAAGLRGQLRLQAVELGVTPDWSTLEVTGPATSLDGLGRTWFEWAATVNGADGGLSSDRGRVEVERDV